jgi:hypothetical protein
VAGGILGGLVGKEVAESINPTVEEAYWQEHYKGRPYVDQGAAYEEYQTAYRCGWESRARRPDKEFEEVEPEVKSGWERMTAGSKLGWDKARQAARDAWQRAAHAVRPSATAKPPDRP